MCNNILTWKIKGSGGLVQNALNRISGKPKMFKPKDISPKICFNKMMKEQINIFFKSKNQNDVSPKFI